MNYLKLTVKVTNSTSNGQSIQSTPAAFAMPTLNYFNMANANNIEKPLVTVDMLAGSKIQIGEKSYNFYNGQEVHIATDIPIECWTGFTIRFKIASCSCKGYRYFSFDLLSVLTEEEFNNPQ